MSKGMVTAGLLAVALVAGGSLSAQAQDGDGYARHHHRMERLHEQRARNFHHLYAEHRMHLHEQRARAFTHLRHEHELHGMMRHRHHHRHDY